MNTSIFDQNKSCTQVHRGAGADPSCQVANKQPIYIYIYILYQTAGLLLFGIYIFHVVCLHDVLDLVALKASAVLTSLHFVK